MSATATASSKTNGLNFNGKALIQSRMKELGDAEKMLDRREKLVVTLNQNAIALSELDSKLTVILGTKLPSPLDALTHVTGGTPVVVATTPQQAVVLNEAKKDEVEQGSLVLYLEQTFMDKGPLTVSEVAKHVLDAGYKSKAKDFKAVVAQTLDVESKKKHPRFKIHGKKLPRNNKWELTAHGQKEASAPAVPAGQPGPAPVEMQS